MFGLNKRTRTTNLLHALDIEPVELKIEKTKALFAKRLLENKFTRGLLESVESYERMSNHFRSKFLNEQNVIQKTQEKLDIDRTKSIIKEIERESKKNGISDSIKT
ncbi:hypothetical protein BpHYR1_012147 [Brachionus plicatilis]|uniref:Uncharacterized protein n=1 Tax=Brachionus plicatilis TaxID=10195 RepID=A0A3M7R839_BRAPC|nr:hypothetical protein BpHYR1_012147 [Brachionus plicatilis]